MATTKIEWADAVWNPVTGCTKVSEGCRHCYAEGIAKRFWGERKFSDVQLHVERLDQPKHWHNPKRIFVNSMSDLFHPDVPALFISETFQVMYEAGWHTFMVLTKRPERMRNELLDKNYVVGNVMLGVSVEDQKSTDNRIPVLLEAPAAKRFVSCEPMLDRVDLSRLDVSPKNAKPPFDGQWMDSLTGRAGRVWGVSGFSKLDWVICGGESGPGARPVNPNWVRSLRDQCQAAGVPFFFKQWGEWCAADQLVEGFELDGPNSPAYARHEFDDGQVVFRVGKKNAGRLLDGVEWNEFPRGKNARDRGPEGV